MIINPVDFKKLKQQINHIIVKKRKSKLSIFATEYFVSSIFNLAFYKKLLISPCFYMEVNNEFYK